MTHPIQALKATKTKPQEALLSRGFVLSGITLLGLLVGVFAQQQHLEELKWLGYSVAFLTGGIPALLSALAELRHGKLDVDLLMVVAALGAASVGHAEDGAILLFLFSLSNALQDWALGRTSAAIQSLMHLHPEDANVLRDGLAQTVALHDLRIGDVLVVKPGERFAADAVVTLGHSSVDESALTGESAPVEKEPGSRVLSGTLNGEGLLHARVERAAGESTLAKLVQLVQNARTQKSPTERFADQLEGPYTWAVLTSIPIIFAVFHFLLHAPVGEAWYRAMTFLVAASPCAVVIATPAAVLSAMAAGARAGVLFKSGAALETLARVRHVAFDKTGTLTTGNMQLVDVVAHTMPRGEALQRAASLETHSEHPVASAITSAHTGALLPLQNIQAIKGKGITGTLAQHTIWAGNRALALAQHATLTPEQEDTLQGFETRGQTTMVLGQDTRIDALLAVADTPRDNAKDAIAALHHHNLRLTMLTGDRQAVAQHIAAQLGLDNIRAELLPEEKLEAIAALAQNGGVAMIGDGINDAPALARANVGVSMGSGSDAALENADVVLVKNDVLRFVGALRLARSTDKVVKFNVLFALGVIVVVGTLALLGHVPLPLAVIAHEGGTVLVCLNGLRLLAHPV